MRKLAVLAVAGGALAFAGSAQAAYYAGPMQGGPNRSVAFEIDRALNGNRYVKNVIINGANFQCENGPLRDVTTGLRGRARVRHGEFRLVDDFVAGSVKRFAGRSRPVADTASGTFKARITFDGPYGTCTTKRLSWDATKQP